MPLRREILEPRQARRRACRWIQRFRRQRLRQYERTFARIDTADVAEKEAFLRDVSGLEPAMEMTVKSFFVPPATVNAADYCKPGVRERRGSGYYAEFFSRGV